MNSLDFEIVNVMPTIHGTVEEQLFNCLEELRKKLFSSSFGFDRILKLSVFFRPENINGYQSQQKKLKETIRLFFGEQQPTFGIITVFPDDDYCISLEALVYKNTEQYILERKTFEGYNYVVYNYDKYKIICAAGICLQDFDEKSTNISQHAEHVFLISSKILAAEGLNFGNVTRIWNYIEDIIGTYQQKNDLYQNYQIFNDVRTLYYSKCEFKNGYPSSTGIGMAKGGIGIEFIAIDSPENLHIIPVKNQLQKDAYRYSENVLIGSSSLKLIKNSTPKFERATLVASQTNGYLLVSGTASIKDEKTTNLDNVTGQTKNTLLNINSLIQSASDKYYDGKNPDRCYYRVYVKRMEDIQSVKLICENYFKNSSSQYLVADICRSELLVEIECVSVFDGMAKIIINNTIKPNSYEAN
jgi:enamine deaminase RidA (YjgF/YER057c/UK114 family)